MEYQIECFPAEKDQPNRMVVTLGGNTYFIQGCNTQVWYVTYDGYTPRRLQQSQLEALPQLQAIGEFYRGWLEGGEDPMLKLFLGQQAPAVKEPVVDTQESLRQWLRRLPFNLLEDFISYTEFPEKSIRAFMQGGDPTEVELNESDMSDLRHAARERGWAKEPRSTGEQRWVETERGPKQVTGEPVGFDGIATTDPQVLKSGAGYYIGQLYQDEQGMWAPYSRNSQHYWPNRDQATLALIDRNYEPKLHV